MDAFRWLTGLEEWHLPILVIVVFAFAFIINWIARRYVSDMITRNADFLRVDPTNYNFLRNAFSFIIYTVAALFILSRIPEFKSASKTIFTATGIVAAIIALASQQALANIFSGLFIIVFKPFRVEDIIEMEPGRRGIVEDITLRHTIIRDFENKRIIVPNSVINNTVIINSDIKDQPIRRHMHLLVSYDAPIDRVFAIIEDEVKKHPYHLERRSELDILEGIPEVEIRILEYRETGLYVRVFLWAEDHIKAFRLHTDVNYAIKKRFDAAGILFPYPVRRVQVESFPDSSSAVRAGLPNKDENE
jgi:small-conductance mechanosensitive channel